jgi:bifunctional UDP-N-acetylglucosamine pyrophosphorylase / glucosamine-1-phosphate N-acetyltransferase
MTVRVVVLAAGLSRRMKSAVPAVLHTVGGRPMILLALETASSLTEQKPIAVIGRGAEEVRVLVGDRAECIVQEQTVGTGNALACAEDTLRGHADHVVVLYGDMPLWRSETLRAMIKTARQSGGNMALLTGQSDEPRGFGRIVRDRQGRVTGIVEEEQATPEQLAIREINLGAYCFRSPWVWDALRRLTLSPMGEYCLTDLAAMAAREDGLEAVPVADPEEWIGINTRVDLAQAEAAMRRRINRRWMEAGVTLQDPATTSISCEAHIGADTLVRANTQIEGRTMIGASCDLGPNTILRDCRIGDRCQVIASVAEEAVMEDDVSVGPFSHLRAGAYLERGVHVGNFGEVKNTRLGAGAKMGHFSYLGDAAIGADANIGAGTITCNFDGEKKNPTTVGAGAFIGSDTMLVAPVNVGRGAVTGAGSVVTRDVPDDSLAVGAPARVIRKVTPKTGA